MYNVYEKEVDIKDYIKENANLLFLSMMYTHFLHSARKSRHVLNFFEEMIYFKKNKKN